MLKKLILLILTGFLCIFYFSTNMIMTIHPFNHTNVKNDINYLASDKLQGRLAGTVENVEATCFIRDEFEKNGLLPFCPNYFHVFNYYYPQKIKENPYLRVLDENGNLIKEYTYGKDFKEDMINFKTNNITFNKNDNLSFNKDSLKIQKTQDKFIFYTSKDDDILFRSSFLKDSKVSMFIVLTKTTFSSIKKNINKGYSVNCFIPYQIKKTTMNNVTGFIKGVQEKKSPIVISAHFDHVGTDLADNVYNGALDNASGTAFILELSRYVKSLGKPNRNILFIGFNAEEFGCVGSKEFVKEYKYLLKDSKVFNFDMIGSNNSVPLCIMGSKTDTSNSPLIKSVSTTCSNEHIYFNYIFEDSSDHESFREENIDAITFIDNDVSRIHTPKDKPAFINTKNIDRCFKVVSKELIKYSFDNNPLFIYYKQLNIFSLIGIFIFSKLSLNLTQK